jgi:hypothetical protein
MLKNFLQKKINRFFESRNIFKLRFIIHVLFKEKNIGDLNFNFDKYPSRAEIVQKIIELKKYKKYLEIGCFKNELFDKISCEKKVGVDPISGGNIRETSDNFFKKNLEKFDCIFIDGLHTYEQVKKDIYNSIKYLNHGGIILLHDCLPSNVYDQSVPRCQYKWNGDVWKALVEIRTKPYLDSYTCFADQGIGIIIKRSNRNILKLKIKNFKKLKFRDYYYDYKKFMNVISEKDIKDLIMEK